MKAPEHVLTDVQRRLSQTWAAAVTSASATAEDASGGVGPLWPHAFPLGRPTGAQLNQTWPQTVRTVAHWRDWAGQHNVRLRWENRRVQGTPQELPTHLSIPDVETAAVLVGGAWPERLVRGRRRAYVLRERYVHLDNPARVVAALDATSDLDVELLWLASDWFAAHDAIGLTPRQVPIEGLHAKWLDTRLELVRKLAGKDDLGLTSRHPSRIHFTYLDATHRAAGGRWQDSATVGDSGRPAYPPQVVVISENKDTALHFPCVPAGVSVEGVGRGGKTAASFDWLADAPAVFYWGDMDADGLEILDGFRADGVPAIALLMNPAAYRSYARFGTDAYPDGRPVTARIPRATPHLNATERALYEQLCAPECAGPRRIEQERIPLPVALAELTRHLGAERARCVAQDHSTSDW